MRPSIPIIILFYLVSCAPTHNARGDYSLKKDNHAILKDQMSDSLYRAIKGRNVKKSSRVVKSKKEAIKLAKKVFIKEYGQNENIEDRIFTSHLLNGFWIVRGLLPKGFNGGTLVAVIDSENGELYSVFVWR